MKILQRNLDRSTFVVWEMKRNVSVVRFKFRYSILISGKIIKEMPGSVASGTHCIYNTGFFISPWNILENWLMPQLNEDSNVYIFQQDGSRAHYKDVRGYLNWNLPQR